MRPQLKRSLLNRYTAGRYVYREGMGLRLGQAWLIFSVGIRFLHLLLDCFLPSIYVPSFVEVDMEQSQTLKYKPTFQISIFHANLMEEILTPKSY